MPKEPSMGRPGHAPPETPPPPALLACGPWSDPLDGDADGAVAVWRLDAIPTGATFDLRLEAEGGTVRVLVAHPPGHEVLDSGWRRLDDDAAGGAGLDLSDLFRKDEAAGSVEVTVRTTAAPTRWTVRLRCRRP
jgi:hypothetical protein